MKCLSATNWKRLAKFFLFLIAVAALSLGIYEAKLLFSNVEYETKDFCNMWVLMYITSVIDMVTAIITVIFLSGYKLFDDENNGLIQIMYFLEFVIAVIALGYKNMMDNECIEYWTNAIPEFLDLIKIHGNIFWLYLCAGFSYIVIKVVLCFYPRMFIDNNDDLLLRSV